MSGKKYRVTRTPDKRDDLDDLLRKGKASALVLTRARILLQADQADGPALDDEAIADDLGVGLRAIVASPAIRRADPRRTSAGDAPFRPAARRS